MWCYPWLVAVMLLIAACGVQSDPVPYVESVESAKAKDASAPTKETNND